MGRVAICEDRQVLAAMRRFPIRAYAMKACGAAAAIIIAFLPLAFASQANAEPPRSADEARQMYERGWQDTQEQLQRQRRPRRSLLRSWTMPGSCW
jgi:hypothetical protein